MKFLGRKFAGFIEKNVHFLSVVVFPGAILHNSCDMIYLLCLSFQSYSIASNRNGSVIAIANTSVASRQAAQAVQQGKKGLFVQDERR